jgi:hypothetical protein
MDVDVGVPLAVAASDSGSEVGIVWSEPNATPPNGPIHFTRVGHDLTILSDSPCLGTLATPLLLSLAPTPTGWLIAATGLSSTDILSLDAAGTPRGTRSLPGLPMGPGGPEYVGARLFSRRGGGALLAWLEDSESGTAKTLHLEMLNEDGSDAGVPGVTTSVDGLQHGVFVGDGFELATIVGESLQLLHAGLDGTLRVDALLPNVGFYPTARLAWSGSEARLVYWGYQSTDGDTASAVFFQRVSQGGATVGDRVMIAGGQFNRFAMGGAIGDDTIVLLAFAGLMRVSPLGVVSSGPEPVDRAPLNNQDLALLGDEAVVVSAVGPAFFDTDYQSRLALAAVGLR